MDLTKIDVNMMLVIFLSSGFITSIIVALFSKMLPKEKMYKIIEPSAIGVGKLLNIILVRWLGKGNAEKIEEGIICSLIYALRKWLEKLEETVRL